MVSRGFSSRTAAVWVVAVVAAAGAAVLVGLDRADGWRPGVAAGCAAAVVLLATGVVVLLRRLAGERADRDRAQRLAEARAAEVAHLAGVRAPAIAERVRAGRRLEGVPGPLAGPGETGADFERAVSAMVVALGSDEAMRRERGLRDSVQAAFESVARTMHAMASVQQQLLDQVERSVDDPRVMADVMKADHAAAQMTRKAQTLLVMCGVWPARRETRPVSLYDCVRGAQSRIVEYSRIEVRGGQTLYAVAPAVEGLMHAIAELLDNATTFSPQNHPVVVNIREVGAGAVLEIEDAGRGMPQDALEQATRLLRDDQDLARLGAVPRLGLACVGRWSRELGFDVKLNGTSAYGGTCAVTFVPFHLMTEPAGQPAAPAQWSASQQGVPQQQAVPQQRQSEPDAVLMSGHGRPDAGVGSGQGAQGAVAVNGGQLPFSEQPLPSTAPPAPGAASAALPAPSPSLPPESGVAAQAATPFAQPPAPSASPAPPASDVPGASVGEAGAYRSASPASPSSGSVPAAAPQAPAHGIPDAHAAVATGRADAASVTAGAAAVTPDAAAAPAETPAGLPRRRSRRGATQAAMQQLPVAQQTDSSRAPAAPVVDTWSPEAAGASIASVVSGTLRGRAALDGDRRPAGGPSRDGTRPQEPVNRGSDTTEASPPPEPSPSPTPDEHDGGRP